MFHPSHLIPRSLWQFIEERDDRDVEVDWEGDWYQEQDSSSGWDTD